MLAQILKAQICVTQHHNNISYLLSFYWVDAHHFVQELSDPWRNIPGDDQLTRFCEVIFCDWLTEKNFVENETQAPDVSSSIGRLLVQTRLGGNVNIKLF